MDLSKVKTTHNVKYSNFDLKGVTYDELVVNDSYRLKEARGLKTIIDIGGNLGMFAVYCRELFPDARIISVEACSDTFEILKHNTADSQVECLHAAIGDGRTLYLHRCPVHSGGNQFFDLKSESECMPSKRLSTLFSEIGVESPYLLKIDIEGGESMLYRDSEVGKIMADCQHFAMEFHYPRSTADDGQPVVGIPTKCEWDTWLQNIFGNKFNLKGIGNCRNASSGLYTAVRK